MKTIVLMVVSLLFLSLTACSSLDIESKNVSITADEIKEYPKSIKSIFAAVYGTNSEVIGGNDLGVTYISFNGNSITANGNGTVVDGNRIAITSAGTYSISGILDDGQIVVRSEDKENVELILNGTDITCSTGSPIYIYKAGKVVVTLAEDTDNYVTDGKSYVFADSTNDEPNAAIFSKDDLIITGSGSLAVKANYNNGIQSKDDLSIAGGNITVNAVNDGIKGRDSLVIKGGNITVNAGGDGMQSTNEGDTAKGYILVDGGDVTITAAGDGIQAATGVTISNGNVVISSGGGSANSNTATRVTAPGNWGMANTSGSNSSSISAKGIKAATDIIITGGSVTADSSDDAINSNDSVTIDGGSITLASGDDGIHADSSVEINGGTISITKCYEGIESAAITINDGTIYIVSSDDGVNVVGAGGEFPMGGPMGGRPGPAEFSASSDYYLAINGGYLVVDANGDGLDVNGTITMTGGVVIINGPTRNDNGALDHSGFKMTGGLLVAAGSSGMAQAPGTSSTQYSALINLTSALSANTMFHIETEDGKDILTFMPTKSYQSVVLCSPELKNGSTYLVYSGGSSNGTVIDGLYSDGDYITGTKITSFTISSIVTSIGSSRGGFPGGMPR